MTDFSKAVEDAQRLPGIPEDLEHNLPDPFKSAMEAVQLVQRVQEGATDQIPLAAEYAYTYHCKRLTIGQVLRDFHNGQPVYEDVDESDALIEIMNKQLSAKAIIFKKETTFLKDGTVVIWVEWGEPIQRSKKDSSTLSIEELLSPESSPSDENSGDNDFD